MKERSGFDYVIVGAGSAGCLLAMRLTEDPATRVLVLEAGGWDRDMMIHIPLGLGKLWNERRHDWDYFTEPEPHVDNREIETARGKIIGGSSSINAMAYVRGNPGDYDRWRQTGLTGWGYDDLLPYFKRTERWAEGANQWRGDHGPLRVRHAHPQDPVLAAFAEAGKAMGYAWNDDFNGERQEGFATGQWTIGDGRRSSAATAFLHPSRSRRNLTVETGVLATNVAMEGTRAIGIDYVKGGDQVRVRADREVILCGGSINSPHLLMLSGIGDPDHLRDHAIEPVIPIPNVGHNLQDHISAAVLYRRLDTGPFWDLMRFDRVALAMTRAALFRSGPATDLPGGLVAFLKMRPERAVPDVQFLFRCAPLEAGPWFPLIKKAWKDAFSCRPVLLHPESRGTVRLASPDPRAAVRIHQNFLATENDRRDIRDAMRLAREIATQPALDQWRGEELAPGKDVQSDADLDAFIRRTMTTVHHPLGTCRMGADSDSVVDPELRVRGAENLRVIDSSVMPDLISGNINAAVYVIAEKASDILRGRTALAAAA